jgi:hypothetical protein
MKAKCSLSLTAIGPGVANNTILGLVVAGVRGKAGEQRARGAEDRPGSP